MIPTGEFALLGTFTALLGVLSHVVVFTRIEWQKLVPILLWIYPALAFLLFLFINSFESDIRTCLGYLSILVTSYCMGLFTSVTFVEILHRKYRPIVQSGPEEIAIESSVPSALDDFGTVNDKAVHKNTTY